MVFVTPFGTTDNPDYIKASYAIRRNTGGGVFHAEIEKTQSDQNLGISLNTSNSENLVVTVSHSSKTNLDLMAKFQITSNYVRSIN